MKLLFLISFLLCSVCFSQKKQSDLEKVITKDFTLEFDSNYFSRIDAYDKLVMLFIKNPQNGYVESLRISVEDVSKYKKMDLEYFSEIKENLLKDEYKILSKTKGELNGNKYIDFSSGKTTVIENNKSEFKNLERLYFHKSKIYKIFFGSSEKSYEKHLPKIQQVLESFKMK